MVKSYGNGQENREESDDSSFCVSLGLELQRSLEGLDPQFQAMILGLYRDILRLQSESRELEVRESEAQVLPRVRHEPPCWRLWRDGRQTYGVVECPCRPDCWFLKIRRHTYTDKRILPIHGE